MLVENIFNRTRLFLARPSIVLLAGMVVAHLSAFASAPFLTRLYSPDAFGLLAIFSSSLAVIGTIAGGRYEQAIVGEQSEKFADALVLVVATISLIVAAILPLTLPFIFQVLGVSLKVNKVVVFLAPASFAYCTGQAFTNWLIRKGGFGVTSVGKVIQALAVLGVSISFSEFEGGLVVGSAAGYIIACVGLAFGSRRLGWLAKAVNIKTGFYLVKKYRRFAYIGAPPALLDALCTLLPVYWAAIYFNQRDVGQFGLSRQILSAPLGMIALLMSQLLMKKLADAKISGVSMLPTIRMVFPVVFMLCIVAGVAVSITASKLFVWVFGKPWHEAGLISAWMIWVYIASMLISPFSSVLTVLRKLRSNGAWQALHCIGLAVILWQGDFSDINQFVRVLVGYELLSYVIYAAVIAHAIYNYEQSICKK